MRIPNESPWSSGSLAYLRTELCRGGLAWQAASDALLAGPDPLGRLEAK